MSISMMSESVTLGILLIVCAMINCVKSQRAIESGYYVPRNFI